jgi:hypothetical protein
MKALKAYAESILDAGDARLKQLRKLSLQITANKAD